jgi:carbonic anhydrase
MTLVCGVAGLTLGAAAARAQSPSPPAAHPAAPWSYEGADGPAHWGDLDPDYSACKLGKAQSPIDIRTAQQADLPAIHFEYKSGPLVIINNGRTAVRVNYRPGNGNFLVVGDERYELTQFHFHRPSEEYLHGKRYAMVLHLVHTASNGKAAAVAVMVEPGEANATVAKLWEHMPRTEGPEHEIAGVQIDPQELLPRQTGYYTYEGSLTAPPCTEGVTWYVLKTPIEVSPAQIQAFAALYPHDVRPLQPRNGRIVRESR